MKRIHGEIYAEVRVGEFFVPDLRIIVAKVTTADGLLGMNFLKLGCTLSWHVEGILTIRTKDGEWYHYRLRKYYPEFSCVVQSVRTTVIPPRSHKLVTCKVEVYKGVISGQTVMVKPPLVLARGMKMLYAVVDADREVWVPVTNFTTNEIVVAPNYDLAT